MLVPSNDASTNTLRLLQILLLPADHTTKPINLAWPKQGGNLLMQTEVAPKYTTSMDDTMILT